MCNEFLLSLEKGDFAIFHRINKPRGYQVKKKKKTSMWCGGEYCMILLVYRIETLKNYIEQLKWWGKRERDLGQRV